MVQDTWKILLVDDDEDDYFLTNQMLTKTRGRKIEIEWASNYEMAEQKLGAKDYDAVLVDYHLGAHTGVELIREMTDNEHHAPAILLTGQGNYDVDLEAMQAGATLYISKDEVSPLLLERTIRYAIERKQAEDELRRARDELAARNDEIHTMSQQLWQTAKMATMGELAASVAHELNNPLAILSLRMENLASSLPENAPEQKDLAVMAQEVDRMAGLIANLLEFSRIGQRQISSLDIQEEIDRTLDLMQNYMAHRHISVQREFGMDVPLIQADRQQMRQLFLNLFSNASEAMPEGGTLTIRVSLGADDSSGGARLPVRIEIQDTGIGISSEHLSRVVEPFFTTKPAGKGTGLGLAICRRIVEEHKGSFRISSTGKGQGAAVHIVLPSASEARSNILL